MERRPRHHVEYVMGMAVSIDVRDPISADAIDEVVALLHHVDATFSTYRPTSPISRLGTGEAALGDMPAEVLDVLATCEALRDDTDGVFDILAVPAPHGGRLDPSGFVKGWAVDRAAAVLERHGARNLCINAGGDIALRCSPTPDASWTVGIRHPDEPSAVAAVVELTGRAAIATSATYERGAHIVDPRTGGTAGDVASATIIGLDLGEADAFATAVFVRGIDGLEWLLDRHPDYAGCVIGRDDVVYTTPNFAALRRS